MKPRWHVFCIWLVVACFLFATAYPDDALAFFDEDTLKTTGIIIGITAGVALLVILVIGIARDMKKDRDKEEDVWSQSPVLRTLGYNPGAFPYLRDAPAKPGALCGEAMTRHREIDLLVPGKVDGIGRGKATCGLAQESSGTTFGTRPSGFSLSHPDAGLEGNSSPFSLRLAGNRS